MILVYKEYEHSSRMDQAQSYSEGDLEEKTTLGQVITTAIERWILAMAI